MTSKQKKEMYTVLSLHLCVVVLIVLSILRCLKQLRASRLYS